MPYLFYIIYATFDISKWQSHLLEIYKTRHPKLFSTTNNYFKQNFNTYIQLNLIERNIILENVLNESDIVMDIAEIEYSGESMQLQLSNEEKYIRQSYEKQKYFIENIEMVIDDQDLDNHKKNHQVT